MDLHPKYRPPGLYSSPPVDPPTLPSLSTIALQDIVEGQQLASNGLVSLLSQEQSTTESNAREHKQQLSNLTSLSEHFLTFMPDVEHKFSALESSIRSNCTNPDNVELQNRVKDMVEVVANLGRIAEGFASSTGLRLVPSQGLAPSPWAWAPVNSQPLQQDPTSFSATFPRAPRLFPAAIPNSSRSSVFAHSTGPPRSVHWLSDLDVPTTSWTPPWSDPYNPYFGTNTALRASRSSLHGGVHAPSAGAGLGPSVYRATPLYYPPTASDPSPNPSPVMGPFMCSFPFGLNSPTPSPPIVQHSPTLGSVPPPRPASSPSQTESVVGSMRMTPVSAARTYRVPPPPALGRTPAIGPSTSTSSIETSSTPSGVFLNYPTAQQSRFSVSTAPVAPNWFGMVYPRSASTVSSDDEYTIPSPPRVEIPNLRPVDAVRWSSSAPNVVERPAPEGDFSLRSSIPSPFSSPVRSVISYAGSTTSELMPPPPCVSDKVNLAPTHPNKPGIDKVNPPKAAPGKTVPSTSTAAASTSNALAPAPTCNPPAIQLVSFFFDTIRRLFKVPEAVELSYSGFEVSFAAASVPWADTSAGALRMFADDDVENARVFELMPAPANATLHRYIKDLARVRMDLAALQAGEDEDPVVEQLVLRVKAELDVAQSWMRRVCAAAGVLSIADPAFSLRK